MKSVEKSSEKCMKMRMQLQKKFQPIVLAAVVTPQCSQVFFVFTLKTTGRLICIWTIFEKGVWHPN
jgi:hypothetical protein